MRLRQPRQFGRIDVGICEGLLSVRQLVEDARSLESCFCSFKVELALQVQVSVTSALLRLVIESVLLLLVRGPNLAHDGALTDDRGHETSDDARDSRGKQREEVHHGTCFMTWVMNAF